jgi:hypothetical protein
LEAVEEAACVPITMLLVRAPVVVGRISTDSGVKVQEAWSGSPEQEMVTNTGAVSVSIYSGDGVTETTTALDCPAVMVTVVGATETVYWQADLMVTGTTGAEVEL